ncbi:MAG: methyltransferase domain-containing protein [Candidatus Omnitrophota bacterium]
MDTGSESDILKKIHDIQKEIELFYITRVIPKVFKRRVRKTWHFKEWWIAPMNYVRIVELPLSMYLLEAERKAKILDISSAKLLSFFLGVNGFSDITMSDLSDFFVEDFKIYSEEFGFSPELKVFDATDIPFANDSFDRVFSISVLEHIADDGDRKITDEVTRILKPGGLFVVTLPAGNVYSEEWLRKQDFPWSSKIREDGRIFFQRRYDYRAVEERFTGRGLEIEDCIFIAEKPIKEPQLNDTGRLLFNYYYLEDFMLIKLLKKVKHVAKIPLLLYAAYRYYSSRLQYLTRDRNDKNIREVAVKLRKQK